MVEGVVEVAVQKVRKREFRELGQGRRCTRRGQGVGRRRRGEREGVKVSVKSL